MWSHKAYREKRVEVDKEDVKKKRKSMAYTVLEPEFFTSPEILIKQIFI
jgi:hypothetical protein